MRLVDRLYDWLSQGPTPDCDRIFAAALPHAEPAWAERMVRVLLLRGRDASWAALIGQYEQLTPEIRALLQYQNERIQAGITLALRSSSSSTRANALLAFEERPLVRMAYLLPNAMRDPSSKVRGLAAQVLHKMADSFLKQSPPPADADEDVCQAYAAQRQQLVLALEEALQAYDLHNRAEVLEAYLWFARDFGDTLWKKLTSRRSHAGKVISEQIFFWDHPRLAHFLVAALKRSAWRHTAAQVLQIWKTIPQVATLLRQNDLLDDPSIRRNLSSVQSPRWFTKIDDDLTQLPPDLRLLAPRWVCYAGYSDLERTALLSRWLHSPNPHLHRATVYALAEIDTPGTHQLLVQVAKSDSPLASFAQWSVQALDAEVVRLSLRREYASAVRTEPEPEVDSTRQDEIDEDCTMLWLACRRTPPAARGELIAALRENAEIWHSQLTSYLQSPDPRDRILVLQVISTEQLALQFRADVESLLSDSVTGIRELAQTLARTLSQPPQSPREPPTEPPRRRPPPDDEALEAARLELRTNLERLANGEADAADADLIGRVRDLLREVYAEQGEPESLGIASEEGS